MSRRVHARAGRLAHAPAEAGPHAARLPWIRSSGFLQRLVVLAAAAVARPVIRPGLGPRLAAREGQAQDRALDLPELLVERPGVVGQLVALADLADLGRDLPVARARHVGIQVVLDLVAEV